MNFDQVPDAGATVYLRPGTRNAPAICYAYAEVEILRTNMPLVLVKTAIGSEIWVHHLNMSLHRQRKAARGQHDQAGGHDQRRIPTMPRTPKLHLEDGEEELTLW